MNDYFTYGKLEKIVAKKIRKNTMMILLSLGLMNVILNKKLILKMIR